MPVMDGKQCLEEILRINPNAKIVLASGYSEGGQASGATAAGAKGFVQKPYNMRQLLTAAREVLDAELMGEAHMQDQGRSCGRGCKPHHLHYKINRFE